MSKQSAPRLAKIANTIKAGDIIVECDGRPRRVTRASKGFWSGSVILEWRGGWACVNRTDSVEIAS